MCKYPVRNFVESKRCGYGNLKFGDLMIASSQRENRAINKNFVNFLLVFTIH